MQTLRSSGVLGVPAIRRVKLTEPKEFQFETAKRAKLKQASLRPKRSLGDINPSSQRASKTSRRETT